MYNNILVTNWLVLKNLLQNCSHSGVNILWSFWPPKPWRDCGIPTTYAWKDQTLNFRNQEKPALKVTVWLQINVFIRLDGIIWPSVSMLGSFCKGGGITTPFINNSVVCKRLRSRLRGKRVALTFEVQTECSVWHQQNGFKCSCSCFDRIDHWFLWMRPDSPFPGMWFFLKQHHYRYCQVITVLWYYIVVCLCSCLSGEMNVEYSLCRGTDSGALIALYDIITRKNARTIGTCAFNTSNKNSKKHVVKKQQHCSKISWV